MSQTRMLKCFTPGLVTMLLVAGCSGSGMSDLHSQVAEIKETTKGEPLDPIPEIKPYRPFAYAAYGLRNPFESADFIDEEPVPAVSGIRPDQGRPKELLEQFALESLKMVGTIDREGLWVLMEAPDRIVHRVGIGNYMGTNHGRITDVSQERVDLVEIVPDGLGGWEQRESYLSLVD